MSRTRPAAAQSPKFQNFVVSVPYTGGDLPVADLSLKQTLPCWRHMTRVNNDPTTDRGSRASQPGRRTLWPAVDLFVTTNYRSPTSAAVLHELKRLLDRI